MSPIHTRTLSLPSLLTYLFGGCVVLLLISYALFQARLMIEGPMITLSDDLGTIQTDRQIVLEGNTENITEITLNDRPIVTSEDGQFQEKIVLENGYTIVSIRAEDRYGRETTLTREFVYTPLSILHN